MTFRAYLGSGVYILETKGVGRCADIPRLDVELDFANFYRKDFSVCAANIEELVALVVGGVVAAAYIA